jgi:molybdate/tungstate transport system substrate-binding protein
MILSRARYAAACVCLVLGTAAQAFAVTPIRVAYAGSMGAVMDQRIGPQFAKAHDAEFQGIGQASYALARLIESREMRADVFVSITPGPMGILLKDRLAKEAVAIARTQMAVAYGQSRRFAVEFANANKPWYVVLQSSGLRFGRTDPATDPQGRAVIFTLMLAENYYHSPGLAAKITRSIRDPSQIFTEPSLLTRLESGQIDATIGYLSAIKSQHLPFVRLPPEINLSDPSYFDSFYKKVSFPISTGAGQTTIATPEPLVFYATALNSAEHPELAAAFIEYLQSSEAQQVLREAGYDAAAPQIIR